MLIFGPLVRPRTSADTATVASAAASDVTVSPSTTRTAGKDTVSPTLSVRLSISMTSPTATFCWVPPLRTIAYTVDLTLCWIGSSYGACTDLAAHTNMARGTRADAQVYGSAHRRVKLASPPGEGPTSHQLLVVTSSAAPVWPSDESPSVVLLLRLRLLRRRRLVLDAPFCAASAAGCGASVTMAVLSSASAGAGKPVASGLTYSSASAETG